MWFQASKISALDLEHSLYEILLLNNWKQQKVQDVAARIVFRSSKSLSQACGYVSAISVVVRVSWQISESVGINESFQMRYWSTKRRETSFTSCERKTRSKAIVTACVQYKLQLYVSKALLRACSAYSQLATINCCNSISFNFRICLQILRDRNRGSSTNYPLHKYCITISSLVLTFLSSSKSLTIQLLLLVFQYFRTF